MAGIMMPYMSTLGQVGYIAPNQIANLNIWYNASGSSTVVNGTSTANFSTAVVNGTAVSQWNDLSGTGHVSSAKGGGSAYPTYATPVQNGLGSVQFASASSNNMDINPISSWSNSLSGFTIFVLAKPTTLPSGTVFPLTATDTNLGIWWNGTNWSVGQSVGNFGTVSVTNDTSKFHIYGMVFDGASAGGNTGRLQFRYDKSGKTLSYTGTIGTTTGLPNYFYFGGDNRSAGVGGATFASKFMDGLIGEVLIWTRALTSSELSSVELYLNTKWNLGLT